MEGISTAECSCVVCLQIFKPATCKDSGDDQMNQLKAVSDVFKVFFLYLHRNNYFSCRSSDWDNFTDTQKLSSFCSSCFSSGVTLSVMYGRLEQLQKEIENFVGEFENAISTVHNHIAEETVSNCFVQEKESVDVSAGNDFLEDFKSECSSDNLEGDCDWSIDFEIKQETSTGDIYNTASEEITPFNPINYAEYSKSVKCNVNYTKKKNAVQSEMKNLCIKLERLPESVCKKLMNTRLSKLQNRTSRRKRGDIRTANTNDSLIEIKDELDEKLVNVSKERIKLKSKSSMSSKYLNINKKLSQIQKQPNKSIIKSQKKSTKPQTLSFNCAPCDLTFTSDKLYNIHVRDHANPKRCKECKICGKIFYGKYSIKKHMSSNHAEISNEYKCSTCEEKFSSKFDLEIHEMIHTGDVPFKCHSCHEIFSNVNTYATHQMRSPCPVYENFNTFECELCEKSFKAKYLLLTHAAEHSKVTGGNFNGYDCTTCGRHFEYMSGLTNHILFQHCQLEYPFTCDICGRPLRNIVALRAHRQSHRALGNFPCSKCEMCFKSKKTLKYHVGRHHPTEGELFKCEVCPKVFKVKEDFRRHVTLHSKSFICDVCGNKFNRSIDLKTHHRSHTGDLLPCLTCDKKFLTLYLLNQHIAVTHFGRSKPCSGKKRGLTVEPDN